MTYIIACVSPAAINFGETLSTLKFAQRAKHIKNNAVVNEDQTGNVANLQQENARLRTQLMQYQALQTANTRRLSLSFTSPTKRQARGNMKGGMTVGLPSLVEEHEVSL